MMWKVVVISIFPEIFPGPLLYSLSGKAIKKGIWNLHTVSIRDFATDERKTVDDRCFGGGPGMVLMAEVVDSALKHALSFFSSDKRAIIYLTPKGNLLNQSLSHSFVDDYKEGCIILCGHYEGIDERVIEKWKENENLIEISVGDYILSGGEIAAFPFIDACVRLLPGVIQKEESLIDESFERGLLETPHYTRPRCWEDRYVPEILLSGNHKKIDAWRYKESLEITKERRADLFKKYVQDSPNYANIKSGDRKQE
ncbi:MAG: tRNA (guanosine(37)-N1)-methyltransferase TrmD [Alphaproteobacteria bacterium]